MKTLRVCHSEDLPSTLQLDFIYYLYDKLEVYIGQTHYSDPYVIIETYPSNPVPGILYFCLDDGYVKTRANLEDVNIAKVESDAQLEILKQAGSMFFVYSDRRYLDARTQLISLPFKNGTYQLSVNLATDVEINENTIIKYNPESGQFEIIGDIQDYNLVFSRRYRGKETDTINTKVEDHEVSSDLKISQKYGNMITMFNDGIYATVNDRVSQEEFDRWSEEFETYKDDMEAYIALLSDLIERAEEIISSDSIARKIEATLRTVYPEIDSALANYDTYAQRIDSIESEVNAYADSKFDATEEALNNVIISATNEPWEDF